MARTFEDRKERKWAIDVSVGSIARVKTEADVDLYAVAEGPLLEELASRPDLLCRVVYALCLPQADAEKVSPEQFAEAMGGDVLDAAIDALLGELIDFFPKWKRDILTKARDKLREMQALGVTQATKLIDSGLIEAAMKKKFDETLATLNANAGGLPVSQA